MKEEKDKRADRCYHSPAIGDEKLFEFRKASVIAEYSACPIAHDNDGNNNLIGR